MIRVEADPAAVGLHGLDPAGACRVAGLDAPMPYFRQEHLYMPDEEDIYGAVQRTLAHKA